MYPCTCVPACVLVCEHLELDLPTLFAMGRSAWGWGAALFVLNLQSQPSTPISRILLPLKKDLKLEH